MTRKPTDAAVLTLRLQERLRKQIEVAAKRNNWSMKPRNGAAAGGIVRRTGHQQQARSDH